MSLASLFLGPVVAGLNSYLKTAIDRRLKRKGELLASAQDWLVHGDSAEPRGKGNTEVWIGLTVNLLSAQEIPLTLTDFHLEVGFLDPLDDYATVQRHRMFASPTWPGPGLLLTLRPQEYVEQKLWACLHNDDLAEIRRQPRSVGMTLDAYDPCGKRYWKRLLMTVTHLKSHYAEELGAGSWYPECDWPYLRR